MVLTKTNLDLLEETAELSKTLGISTFCATKALPNISTSNNREFLLNTNEAIDSINRIDSVSHKLDLPVDVLGCYPKCLLAKTNAFERFANRACVAGCTTLTIGPDGKVRPCSHIDRSYGNIFEEPLKNIWDRMDDWKTNKFVPEECSNCSLFNMCRGGCRVNNPQNDLHCLDYYADVEYLKAKNFEIKLLNKNRARVSAPLGPFIVNPDVNFREESFGFLIFGGSQKMIIQFVNQKAGSYLKCQKENGREFTVIDFVESSGAKTEEDKEKVKELFSKFIAKRILILKQKGGIKNEK
jgi:radical SAM protein with 4Fe4S-binding SPASM domain